MSKSKNYIIEAKNYRFDYLLDDEMNKDGKYINQVLNNYIQSNYLT